MANTIVRKVGAVTFEHTQDYSGEVDIERNGLSVKVPMAALQDLVAERVRVQLIADVQDMKPHEILALAAARGPKAK